MYQSSLVNRVVGVFHAFGDASAFMPYQDRFPNWQQVHGRDVRVLDAPSVQAGSCDALITSVPGVPLPLRTADCMPILMASPGCIAAIHAGWRGLVAGIVPHVIAQLPPGPWVAAVGPAIGPCCFHVKDDVRALFQEVFGAMAIDLPQMALHQLRKAGVEAESLGICTHCNPSFCSFRRDRTEKRQLSLVVMES